MAMQLSNGESGPLVDPLSVETLQYIGSSSDSQSAPDYLAKTGFTTYYINNNDDLATAVGKLDHSMQQNMPLGTVIAFLDLVEDGTGLHPLLPDFSIWHFLNNTGDSDIFGASLTFGDGKKRIIPDSSNRYLVGMGTDGTGNIGAGSYTISVVGNAGHTQPLITHLHDIQHGHGFTNPTMGAHSHSGPNHKHAETPHTHTMYSHSHAWMTQGQLTYDSSGAFPFVWNSGAATYHCPGDDGVNTTDHAFFYTSQEVATMQNNAGTDTSLGGTAQTGTALSSNTTTGGSVTALAAGNNSQNSGSYTQLIQPRSIPVRWLIKYN